LDTDQIEVYLKGIEFEILRKNRNALKVKVPSFRVDVSRPQDLMEEVARRHGYDNIPVTYPPIPAGGAKLTKPQSQRQRIRNLMAGLGFVETINYSFIHQASADRLRLPESDQRRRTVAILNPLTEDQAVMRSSLLPGLLETAQKNIAHQARMLKLYEIGNTFIEPQKDVLPLERELIAGLWTGERSANDWFGKSETCDFYDLKGVLEALLSSLKVVSAHFSMLADAECFYTRPGACARILVNGSQVGLLGELHPQVGEAYDLKQPVFVFEIDMEQLLSHIPESIQAQPIPKYPSTARDATLIVDNGLEARSIIDHVLQLHEPLVEQVRLFDLFTGRPIPSGRKSISLRITYRSSEKTLEDETINQLHKKITEILVSTFKADLPA
jgi:phenylalanyl-tRNA synthetase beta chain